MTQPIEPQDPAIASVQESPRRRFPLVPLLALCIVVAGAVTGLLLWQRRGPDPIKDAKERVDQRRQIEQQTAKSTDQERIAMAKRACQEAIDHGQKTLDLVTEFEQELKQWEDNVVVLLTNDRGKALAATPAHIVTYRKLTRQRRPTKADGEAIRTRISTFLEPVRAALAAEHTVYKPSAEFTAALEADRTAIIGLIEQYRAPRLEIQALVNLAERSGKPADVTLEQAIRALDAEHADEQARAVATAEEAARKEGDKVVATARAEAVRRKAEDEAKRLQAEKDLEAAQAESKRKEIAASREAEEKRGAAEAAKILETAKKQENRRIAQTAEVKALLAPFTADGYWQPGVQVGQSTDKIPVSLSKLRAFGALDNSPEGLQKLLTAGTGPYHRDLEDKVRPRWSWPALMNALKPDQLEQLKKAQKYLRELDTTLVELKMLSE